MSSWGTHQADLFDGDTYEPSVDRERLGDQARAVYDVMIDGEWRTLFELVNACASRRVRASESSVSARLRDFRKEKFGGHIVNRRRRQSARSGTFEYQLLDPARP